MPILWQTGPILLQKSLQPIDTLSAVINKPLGTFTEFGCFLYCNPSPSKSTLNSEMQATSPYQDIFRLLITALTQ
jgi:hypothetical protein